MHNYKVYVAGWIFVKGFNVRENAERFARDQATSQRALYIVWSTASASIVATYDGFNNR